MPNPTPDSLSVKEAIEQGNRLIAEFMDYNYSKSGKTVRKAGSYSSPYRLTDIKFHYSWDQLMPAAKKIIETKPLRGKAMAHINEIERVVSALMTADLKKIYIACVVFVEWYNSQSQTTHP
jgi:hypothetical protein